MHDDPTPPTETDADETAGRYRTIDFADGLLIFDRTETARWIHASVAVPLAEMR